MTTTTSMLILVTYIYSYRDVKMGFNPWTNPAHHRFEPGWVEKNLIFSKVGW